MEWKRQKIISAIYLIFLSLLTFLHRAFGFAQIPTISWTTVVFPTNFFSFLQADLSKTSTLLQIWSFWDIDLSVLYVQAS